MVKLKTHIKKIIAISIAAITASLVIVSPASADDAANKLLSYIAQFTFDTAQSVYITEGFTYSMLNKINAFVLPDDSDTTANLQTGFSALATATVKNDKDIIDLQPGLTKSFLGDLNSSNVPYVNDFTYQTLLGIPYEPEDPRAKKGEKVNSPYNYLKNVAGLNITHITPSRSWKGPANDVNNYKNFYTTISSIQTYNAYILSGLYQDAKGENKLTQQQQALTALASNSDWFVQVSSEKIGVVLRQILMFNSQTYVLMTQMLQTQKQALAAQAMTNTLMVVGNQFTEMQLLNRAMGTMPGQ